MSDTQRSARKILSEKLAEIRAKNSSYSLRAFAKKLELPASMLSEILNGKRKLTAEAAQKIALKLFSNPKEEASFLALFAFDHVFNTATPLETRGYTELDRDQFRLIAEWYHFAILSLAETSGFSDDPEWVAKRLFIKPSQVTEALSRMMRLGLLVKDDQGMLRASGAQYITTDNIANASVHQSHAQDLELARTSLAQDTVSERDFLGITMAIDPAKLSEARKMTREFRDRLCSFLESGEKREVYKMCFNLFPLTKSGEPT